MPRRLSSCRLSLALLWVLGSRLCHAQDFDAWAREFQAGPPVTAGRPLAQAGFSELDDLGDLGDLGGLDGGLGGSDLGDGDLLGDPLPTPNLGEDPLPELGDPDAGPGLFSSVRRTRDTLGGPPLRLGELAKKAVIQAGAVVRAEKKIHQERRALAAKEAERWPSLDLKVQGRSSNHRRRIGDILGPDLKRTLERPLTQIANDDALLAGLDMTAPLYRGGLFLAREDQVRQKVEVARLEHLRSVEAVLLRLVELYLEGLLHEAERDWVEAQKAALELSKAEALSRSKDPFLRQTLRLEKDLEIFRLNETLLQLNEEVDRSRARLEALVGELPPEGRLEPSFEISAGPSNLEEVERLAKVGNLQVKIQLAMANAARSRVKEEESRRYPTLDLNYKFRHSAPTTHDRVTTDYWRATLDVNLPLFDGGHRRAKKHEAAIARDRQDHLVQETMRRAVAEARAAFQAEARAQAEMARTQSLVSLARARSREVQDRVDQGSLMASDAAQAQVAVRLARLQAFRVQARVVRWRVRLHALLGQLVLDKFFRSPAVSG